MICFTTWMLAIPCGITARPCSSCHQGQRWSNEVLTRSNCFFAHLYRDKETTGRVSSSVIMCSTLCAEEAFDLIWIAFLPPTGTFLSYVPRGPHFLFWKTFPFPLCLRRSSASKAKPVSALTRTFSCNENSVLCFWRQQKAVCTVTGVPRLSPD